MSAWSPVTSDNGLSKTTRLHTGWDVPIMDSCTSEDTLDSQNKSVTSLHASSEKRGADAAEASGTLTARQIRSGDTGNSATVSKLVPETTGAMGYNSAMRKATLCARGGTPNAKSMPDALKKGNSQAVKFLDLLKGEPAKGSAETAGARAGQPLNPVPNALAKWASRNQREDMTEGPQRSFNILAGPAFSPGNWFQGSATYKIEVAELASSAEAKAAARGPDVSGFPRPSDRLAFGHTLEQGVFIKMSSL